MSRTILVATDGTSAALGALRLAQGLATSQACRIEVLGVVEPVPVFDAGFMVALQEIELFQTRQDALKHEIENQLAGIGARPSSWTVHVEAGLPAARIVQKAEEVGADTICMGLGRHRPMDRVFGTETALQVIRISHIPVLAVPETVQELPHSAAFGVDFSLFSRRAAEAAAALLASPWEAHLVHVMSGLEFLPAISEEWVGDYEEEIRERLEDFGDALPTEGTNQVHIHVLEGEPAHQLLTFAEARSIDLLVAGSHGLSFMGRLLMGSVSTRLIRGATVSVMVVPPVERWEKVRAVPTKPGTVHPWVRTLSDFTRANAGRRSTLELHDPEMGAQECGTDIPFWGVDYDPKRDRVNIMRGRSGTVEGHLTHSLPAPQDVQVSTGEHGRPEALHIRLRKGQVVLRILRE